MQNLIPVVLKQEVSYNVSIGIVRGNSWVTAFTGKALTIGRSFKSIQGAGFDFTINCDLDVADEVSYSLGLGGGFRVGLTIGDAKYGGTTTLNKLLEDIVDKEVITTEEYQILVKHLSKLGIN